jgi:hypothetical protein
MNTQREWLAVLRESLKTDERPAPMSTEEVEALIADIISGRSQATRKSRHRRRWFAGGTAVVMLAGGATAAAVWPRAKPSHPEQGIACHATLDAHGDAAVIPPAANAIDACQQLWLEGALPDIRNGSPKTDVAPPLFACVSAGGGLEVFPNLADPPATCSTLGLSDADINVSNDPIVVLQEQLADNINLVCVDVDKAEALASQALKDTGLGDWKIVRREGAKECVKAAEDVDTKTIFLQSLPNQPPTT